MKSILIFFVFAQLFIGSTYTDKCTARGKFPNDKSADCRGYSMCLPGASNVFTQVDLVCPEGFVYSHIDNQCTNNTNYKCFSSYNCTNVGNFKYTRSEDCTSYVACIKGLSDDDVVDARLIQCPINTLFNPDKAICVNGINYHCNNNVMEWNALEENQETASNTDRQCIIPGTFPNNKQPNCKGYSECLPGSGDVLVHFDVTCPDGFIYSHIDHKCTNATNYKCLSSFNCTTLGNFKNPFSEDCTSYVSCISGLKDNDIVTARLILCQSNTIFNENKGVCVDENIFLCDGVSKVNEIKVFDILDSTYNSAATLCDCYVILIFIIVYVSYFMINK